MIQEGQLEINAPAGVLTDDVVSQLRQHKTEILSRLSEGLLEYKDFPRYQAALQQGLQVICRHCEYYNGPHAKALGWCRKFDTDTWPDVPFTCGAASRA